MIDLLKVLIVGGAGALGNALVSEAKSKGYFVVCVDYNSSPNADKNIIINQPFSMEKAADLTEEVSMCTPLDIIICVAGGWKGGSIEDKNFIQSVQEMWECNVASSALAASFLPHLKAGGLAIFTSAKASLSACPSMTAYGMAKSSVNSLVKSCAAHLGDRAYIIGILPETLDTEANRKAMPGQDPANWTPLPTICDLIFKWTAKDVERPISGSLVTIITRNGVTSSSAAM